MKTKWRKNPTKTPLLFSSSSSCLLQWRCRPASVSQLLLFCFVVSTGYPFPSSPSNLVLFSANYVSSPASLGGRSLRELWRRREGTRTEMKGEEETIAGTGACWWRMRRLEKGESSLRSSTRRRRRRTWRTQCPCCSGAPCRTFGTDWSPSTVGFCKIAFVFLLELSAVWMKDLNGFW